MHPEGYQCFFGGCRTKCVSSFRSRSELIPTAFARIKRRSAFVKHVKAKHHLDITSMSVEEAAAAADTGKVSLSVEKAATPPPDYRVASMARVYQEEELPTFQSEVMPKEEVYTPPPPTVIDIIPSPDGSRWSPAHLIGSCFHRPYYTTVNRSTRS